MKRVRLLTSTAALVLAASLTVFMTVSMTAAQGGATDGITRGAAQPNQNKWSALAPWGQTERSAPMSAQRKAPFKVFDNLYYVGFQTVSVYLMTTSQGLVLLDSGYAETVDWVLDSVRTLGFDPANIKYILVTHSHADHASGAARLKQITGARVGLSAVDWGEVERQQSDPRAQRNFPMPIQRDLVLKENEPLTVGDTTFKFYFTPGHTPGAMSIEFPVKDRGRTYRAIEPGGLGVQYAPQFGPEFKASIQKLKALGPWDVALGNHPFLAPKDLEQVEAELKSRGQGPHPDVLGPAKIDEFFAAILKVVDQKLVAEPPPATRTQ